MSTPSPRAKSDSSDAENPAVAMMRAKVAAAYQHEPNAKAEVQEVEELKGHLTKHQQFIHDLNHSGKSLAEIQTAWHTYYTQLPDEEKHEVWQEFYKAHEQASHYAHHQPSKPAAEAKKAEPTVLPPAQDADTRTEAEIKQQLLKKVAARGKRRKLTRKEHAKSLIFGLSMGFIVIFALMFTFFNERFITPFITPSTTVSATPIIVDPNNNTVGPASLVIIPKINVEIPVLYDVPSIDENAIQQGLAESVVHYPTTPNPGELGNGVIFGHSSSNIFNSGKAKFAFLQLHNLQEGDTFYLNKGGKQFTYKVISKKVVPPTEVSVLNDTLGRPATFTLITCDPPGLNVNRLVVTGEQISPAPAADKPSTAQPTTTETPSILPGNSESLWHRLTSWLTD